MKRILITGAAGQIVVALRSGLRGSYPLIRLVDIAPLGKTEVGEEIVAADIRDIAAMEKVLTDIDCVVHLAGASVESPWDKVLPLNIEGCYNTFEAARRQGVKRVIFASSNHAVGFHRRERFIDNTVPQEPCSTRDQHHVIREAESWFIAIPPEETKTSTAIEFAIPELLTPCLSTYLDIVRPRMLQSSNCTALWVSPKGGALSYSAIRGPITVIRGDYPASARR